MLIWHCCGNIWRNAGNVRPISEEESTNTCSRNSRLIDLEIEGRNYALSKTGKGEKKTPSSRRAGDGAPSDDGEAIERTGRCGYCSNPLHNGWQLADRAMVLHNAAARNVNGSLLLGLHHRPIEADEHFRCNLCIVRSRHSPDGNRHQ